MFVPDVITFSGSKRTYKEKFEDIKVIIRIRKSKVD